MAVVFRINVILGGERVVSFEGIEYGKEFGHEKDGVRLHVSAEHPAAVTVTPPAPDDPVRSVEYDLSSDIRNYHKVIIPESGRWYMNATYMVGFWRYKNESAVKDFKMPIYIFTGQDLNMRMAFGVIGRNYETSFRTLEPRTNRALIAYMRRLSIRIKRGTDLFPIPDSLAKANPDGAVTEHLYFRTAADAPNQPWMLTLRDFAEYQKKLFDIPDVTTPGALHPLWCSWTDWFSDDVTDEVIVRSVAEGVKLGIRNFIIDDGWFGPGLDNDYDVELNIGDWRPDPAKIKDMGALVRQIKALGGVPMIWCAPHAVARGADCFPQRKKHLIVGENGELLETPNKFHCLCFMCPEAREIMADLCASLIREWDFDGAKYDLFNSVPTMRCSSGDHEHDVTSMMEGLEKTLELIDRKSRAVKKDYIVELKQNYGTPFLARYGSMTRAGDTPYNPQGNFERTLYVQAYSPYSINDYQTITGADSPESAACVVIKMIAVGIPTYSIDFDRLTGENKAVLAHYNNWYNDHIDLFGAYRVPLDGEHNLFKLPSEGRDVFFVLNDGGPFEIDKSSTILNGTFKSPLFIRCEGKKTAKVRRLDCAGSETDSQKVTFDGWTPLEARPGGRIEIDFE